MTELLRAMKPALPCSLCWIFFLGTLPILTSCGGTKQPLVGLPGPTPAGAANTYVGSQGNSPSQQSPWSVAIDRTKNSYSYNNPNSAMAVSTTGSFSALTGGFLVLLDKNGYQNGLALEIPGQAVVLRPGDSTTAPVFAVQQASCFAIGGNVKFLFAYSPGLTGQNQAFFGRIYASTNSAGSSWQFNNQTEYVAPDGKNIPANSDLPGYPSGYSGACTASNGSAAVTSAPLGYFKTGTSNAATYSLPTEYVISPSGFFFENQSYVNVPVPAGWAYPDISAWGVSEPSAPLALSTVATANYVGFLFEANTGPNPYRTRLVGFGNAPISGTVMNGGTLPNEDPTQAPTLNMSITFGKQDPLNNGLYYFAKLTIPYDGGQSTCATPVPSQNGTLACTYPAVAMVGSPNEQFAIMLSATDGVSNQKTLVLFQQ